MKFAPAKPLPKVAPALVPQEPARRTADDMQASTQVNLDAFKKGEEPLGEEFVRVPFGNHNTQLHSSIIPGYHLHWINDWHPQMADRLHQALRAGYRYVSPEEVDTVPTRNGGNPNADIGGTRVSRIVGTRPDGQPITAYLMKIPEQWWMEHQKQIADRADSVDKAIRRGTAGGVVEGAYVPKNQPIKLKQELHTQLDQGDMNG